MSDLIKITMPDVKLASGQTTAKRPAPHPAKNKNYPVLDERKIAFAAMPEIFTGYTGTRINAATQTFPIQAYQCISAYLKLHLKGFKTCVIDMGVLELKSAWHAYR